MIELTDVKPWIGGKNQTEKVVDPFVFTQLYCKNAELLIFCIYMKTIKLQQRGVLTLPKKIREKLDLFEGQILRVEQKGNQIVLEPEQSFDAQIASDLKQGLEDIKKGNFIEFGSLEEFDKKIKNNAG